MGYPVNSHRSRLRASLLPAFPIRIPRAFDIVQIARLKDHDVLHSTDSSQSLLTLTVSAGGLSAVVKFDERFDERSNWRRLDL